MKTSSLLLSSSLLVAVACGPDPMLSSVDTPDPDIVADPTPARLTTAQCFWGTTPGGSRIPMTKIIHELVTDDLGDRIDVTIVFNREFVDLSYGTNAVGWEDAKKGTHTFKDLYKSDHTELALLDGDGEVAFQARLDLLSESEDHPSGYGSLGIHDDGDGKLIEGDESHLLSTGSSLDHNINVLGYELFEDSPETDVDYTPDDSFPDWDFYVRYHMSVDAEAFEPAGFGMARMESVHASPSKLGENTVTVEEDPCPDPGDPGNGGGDDPFGPDTPNGGGNEGGGERPDPNQF